MGDRDVVAAIIAGDPAGLAGAYDAYAPGLHAYCRTLLGEPADAADAVQDTFVIAAAKADGLRDPDRLRPWLYAIARNECHRRLRARARQAGLDEAGEVTDPAGDVAVPAQRQELRALVLSAIAGLNPGDREVIELNLRHDLDGADLAGALGVPLRQAHALASRARSQFERALGALLVARTGRRQCDALDAVLAGWDGQLTPLLRKRVSRHIENCEICEERKRRVLSPAMLLSVAPLVPVPAGLRHQVLRLVADTERTADEYRRLVVSRAEPFAPDGFPVPVDDAGRGTRPRRPDRPGGSRGGPSVAASVGIAAALLLLAGGAVSLLLLGGRHHLDLAGPASPGVPSLTAPATTPAAASPTPAALSTPQAAVPGGVASPQPLAPAPSSSSPAARISTAPPPHSSQPPAGKLSESPDLVVLHAVDAGTAGDTAAAARRPAAEDQVWTGTFTVSASGAPATFIISAPGIFTLSPFGGSVTPGTPVTVTVSVTASGQVPQYSSFTVNPGGLSVIVEFPPAAPTPTPTPTPSPSPSSPPPPPPQSIDGLAVLPRA
jgi:RNA polymerase sigma factor (sigma-70 family)